MDMAEALKALGALAQESRLGVFRLLIQQGPAGLPAGQISERLGIPATTLSFHLAQLGHSGLIRPRRDGRSIIYTADYEAMQALMGFLMKNCCSDGTVPCEPTAPPKRTHREEHDGPL
jgi:ArsR family transcriptional regulator